jgi:hypothetical protein
MVQDQELTFGVSGMLYKNNLLMYDHQTESLWLQVKHEAVTGPMTGARLKVLPSTVTTWEKWKRTHPETTVLSMNTGYSRDYTRDPYADYYRSSRTIFDFVRDILQGHEAKELVAGISLEDYRKAYPLEALRKKGRIIDILGGQEIVLEIDPHTDILAVTDHQGNNIPVIVTYWFVWKDIHPGSLRFDF